MITKLTIKIALAELAYPEDKDFGAAVIAEIDGKWFSGYFDGNEKFLADIGQSFSEAQISYWFEIPQIR